MLKAFCLASLCLLACVGNAQQRGAPVDSLKTALANHPKEDTTRVWLLLQLTNAVFTSNVEHATQYADQALLLSRKIQWDKGLAYALNGKGSMEYLKTDYASALDYYLAAMNTKELEHNKTLASRVANNLGNIYGDIKEYDKSLIYYHKSLHIARELKSKEDQAMALGNMGTVLQLTKKMDSALVCYQEALVLAEAADNVRMIANMQCILGALYKETGNYPASVNHSEKSIALARSSGNQYILSPALNNLAWAYLQQGDLQKAEPLSKESLAVALELENVQWQSEAWEALYTLYEKQGDPAKTLSAYKTYIRLRDSVINDEKKQELTRKELQYASERKEVLLKAAHSAAMQRQAIIRNSVIAGTILLLLAATIVFFFYKRRRDAEIRRKEAELKVQVTEIEMKVMRLQMNPHFIFNSLNSIGDYIANNNTQAADDYLAKFAKVMRMMLEHSEQPVVSLSEDLEALELYLQLEALRMKGKFNYSISVDRDIDQETTQIPPFILQPYVENSIWHGFATKTGLGNISIRVKKEGSMLHCVVEDDGVGRQALKENLSPSGNSMGMKITKARIDILNQVKKTQAGVQVYDMPTGTKVEMRLPLDLKF